MKNATKWITSSCALSLGLLLSLKHAPTRAMLVKDHITDPAPRQSEKNTLPKSNPDERYEVTNSSTAVLEQQKEQPLENQSSLTVELRNSEKLNEESGREIPARISITTRAGQALAASPGAAVRLVLSALNNLFDLLVNLVPHRFVVGTDVIGETGRLKFLDSTSEETSPEQTDKAVGRETEGSLTAGTASTSAETLPKRTEEIVVELAKRAQELGVNLRMTEYRLDSGSIITDEAANRERAALQKTVSDIVSSFRSLGEEANLPSNAFEEAKRLLTQVIEELKGLAPRLFETGFSDEQKREALKIYDDYIGQVQEVNPQEKVL